MEYRQGAEFQFRDSCVSFGTFDGVHAGHRAILERMKETGCHTVVLALEEEGPVLTTPREKQYLMEGTGIDALVSIPAPSMPDPEEFIREFVVKKAGAKFVVVSEHFSFGKTGSVALLKKLGEELCFSVITIPEVKIDGEVVSKAAIRRLFDENRFMDAKKLLGGPYLFIGPVGHGKEQGRKFGMPTANLVRSANKILPPLGVYGCISRVEGQAKQGMTNIGRRPSDDDMDYISVETFILGFSGDIYEKEQILEVEVFIRGIIKFEGGLAALRKQIDKDIAQVGESISKLL